MKQKTKRNISRVSVILLLAGLTLLMNHYCGNAPDSSEVTDTSNLSGIVEVHFIDVGQGDAILIESENESMLIDAGENNKGTLVSEYLKSQNITNLDYVIGTHPHSDHIGGLDQVINSFSIGMVILPSVVHTTDTYEDLLDAVENNQLSITNAVVGNQYSLGSATFTILAPNSSSYEDLNNYSVVIKLTYDDTSFLFTGDAEKLSETEMLSGTMDLTADVLKLGHHGSAYSTNEEFLDAVHPDYVVISVGKDNKYDHPHAETLQAMQTNHIKVYRTDVQGSVVFTSDGKNISVNTQDYKITEADLESR